MGEHALAGGSGEMSRWLLDGIGQQQQQHQQHMLAAHTSQGSRGTLLEPNQFDLLGQMSVLQQLDVSLMAWRTEMTALQSMAGGAIGSLRSQSVPALHRGASNDTPVVSTVSSYQCLGMRGHASFDLSNQDAAVHPSQVSSTATAHREPSTDLPAGRGAASASCAWPASSSSAAALAVSPAGSTLSAEGLPWLRKLPHGVQGRIAACRSIAGALEVLDEALLGLPLSTDKAERSSQTDAGMLGESASLLRTPERSGGRWGRRQSSRTRRSEEPENAADLVAASAELLRTARARVTRLEDELQERQERHNEQVAELCRRQRRDRRRASGTSSTAYLRRRG